MKLSEKDLQNSKNFGKKTILTCLIITILFAAGCAQQQEDTKVVVKPKACPASCDDGNICTTDYCSENTNFECKHSLKTPCCGDGKCEEGETYTNCLEDCAKEVALNEELVAILDQNRNVDEMKYRLEDGKHNIYVWIQGDIIKYELAKASARAPFDTGNSIIILDIAKKTAYGYCFDEACDEELVARTVDYSAFKLKTPLDYAKEIKLDAETMQEEEIDNRNTMVIKYKEGDLDVKMWVTTFNGVPLVIEKTRGDDIVERVRFFNIAFNVRDYEMADHEDLEYMT